MANSRRPDFKYYSLPLQYCIRTVTKQDYWKICKYEFLYEKKLPYIIIFSYVFPILFFGGSILFVNAITVMITIMIHTAIFIIPIIYYVYSVHIYYYRSSNTWIIEYRRQIVGQIKFKIAENFSNIISLSIHHKHRKIGLGSYLVSSLVKNLPKPIYLLCFSEQEKFYLRLGFIRIAKKDAPQELKSSGLCKIMALF